MNVIAKPSIYKNKKVFKTNAWIKEILCLVFATVFLLKYLLLHQLLPNMHYTEQIQVYQEKRNYELFFYIMRKDDLGKIG